VDIEEQLALTASEAVAAIADGRLSALDYTTTLLDRADQLVELNTVIMLNREGARAAAAQVDAPPAAGSPLGRLAGLPVLVKDNINTKDLPTTGGTPALRDFRPTADAAVLEPLLAAGAIVLGKANLHELAFGITNTNLAPFAGTARNPYDRSRIPGGSSGGTAAAIAARIAPAGLGSDTGGSVRVPAAFTGTVGLRPSTGGSRHRYPAAGVLPISHTLDTAGPMARTVVDVALLDSVVTGEQMPAPATLRGLRFGVPAVLWSGLERAVDAVGRDAKERLAAAGVTLVDVDVPELLALTEQIAFPVALHEAGADITAYLEDSGARGTTVAAMAERIASPDVRRAFEAVCSDAMAAWYPDAMNVHRPRLQQIYAEYFADTAVDAILFPTSPVLPAPIDEANGSGTLSVDGGEPVDTFTTTIRNMTPGSCAGVPSLALPAGTAPGGLPVGISLDGPVGSDRRLLAIGMAVQSVLGSPPAPPI
jgi:indoleacetamide hydrolase